MKNDSSRFGHIIQLFTVLLTAILISLFFAALVLVGKIQGTARVVNYAGLVRGKTQRIVKLEISGTPEDDLLGDVASYIEGLRFGSSELDLVRLDDADFQAKMTALSSEFDDLRNELILVRQRGSTVGLKKGLHGSLCSLRWRDQGQGGFLAYLGQGGHRVQAAALTGGRRMQEQDRGKGSRDGDGFWREPRVSRQAVGAVRLIDHG